MPAALASVGNDSPCVAMDSPPLTSASVKSDGRRVDVTDACCPAPEPATGDCGASPAPAILVVVSLPKIDDDVPDAAVVFPFAAAVLLPELPLPELPELDASVEPAWPSSVGAMKGISA